jgi:hypothetical protein
MIHPIYRGLPKQESTEVAVQDDASEYAASYFPCAACSSRTRPQGKCIVAVSAHRLSAGVSWFEYVVQGL